MTKSGYNPVRRNRNIGTAKQGHGRTNAFTVPLVCNAERIWWENLGPHAVVKRKVGSHDITFLVEHTREDCVHACTVDDICHVLSLVSASDLEFLDSIVLRQSTRKQALASPAWGRLAYSAEIGQPGGKTRHSGPALFLEATDPKRVWKWSKKLGPRDALELERLRRDGHRVEDTGKLFVFYSNLESIRATQLYRTLLHEVGHWVDWLEKVVRPAGDDSELYSVLSDRYFARPEQDREVFAHRYADALRNRLTVEGRIPFERIGSALGTTGETQMQRPKT
jgi:hypothetical protein